MKYLTSLSTFDSSDPTKDWGFPKLQADGQNIRSPNLKESIVRETANEIPISEHSSALLDQAKVSEKVALSHSRSYSIIVLFFTLKVELTALIF